MKASCDSTTRNGNKGSCTKPSDPISSFGHSRRDLVTLLFAIALTFSAILPGTAKGQASFKTPDRPVVRRFCAILPLPPKPDCQCSEPADSPVKMQRYLQYGGVLARVYENWRTQNNEALRFAISMENSRRLALSGITALDSALTLQTTVALKACSLARIQSKYVSSCLRGMRQVEATYEELQAATQLLETTGCYRPPTGFEGNARSTAAELTEFAAARARAERLVVFAEPVVESEVRTTCENLEQSARAVTHSLPLKLQELAKTANLKTIDDLYDSISALFTARNVMGNRCAQRSKGFDELGAGLTRLQALVAGPDHPQDPKRIAYARTICARIPPEGLPEELRPCKFETASRYLIATLGSFNAN